MCLSSGRRGTRALFRPTSKVREKCPGDEVGYLAYFFKKKMCLLINSIPKIVIQFCYLTDLRPYVGIETVSCRLLLQMGRIDVDWNSKHLGQLRVLMPFQAAKYPQENYYGLSDSWWNCVISSSRHYRNILCTDTLSNDFSIELIPKVAISSWPDSPFKTCDHLLKISFVVDRWTFLYWRELICKIKQING